MPRWAARGIAPPPFDSSGRSGQMGCGDAQCADPCRRPAAAIRRPNALQRARFPHAAGTQQARAAARYLLRVAVREAVEERKKREVLLAKAKWARTDVAPPGS
jgi:hypothetical protein